MSRHPKPRSPAQFHAAPVSALSLPSVPPRPRVRLTPQLTAPPAAPAAGDGFGACGILDLRRLPAHLPRQLCRLQRSTSAAAGDGSLRCVRRCPAGDLQRRPRGGTCGWWPANDGGGCRKVADAGEDGRMRVARGGARRSVGDVRADRSVRGWFAGRGAGEV